jgi:hypothetical protein
MDWLNDDFKREFINEFSNKISKYVETFNDCGIYDFSDIHKYEDDSQITQTRTACLAPYAAHAVFKVLKDLGIKVEKSDGYDHDIIVEDVKIEQKTFQGSEPSSGGFAKKVGNHLFIKYQVDNNRVNKLFIAIGNIRRCINSKWSDSGSTTSYSKFQLSVNDVDKFKVICGSLRKKVKWCAWEMEDIEWN